MNKVKRTCLCGCVFEYSHDKVSEASHKVEEVFNKCPDHAHLGDKALFLQITSEDVALAETSIKIANQFPQLKKLDEDGNPISEVDPSLVLLSWDTARNIVVVIPSLTKKDLNTAKTLVVSYKDKEAERKAVITDLSTVSLP